MVLSAALNSPKPRESFLFVCVYALEVMTFLWAILCQGIHEN
ncbi:hypothetical protein EG68_11539 [Paragonimus skrjabini miyazakii]|uniref:Uncharacterized protein n=1 Tax=Paragonimus skrjabini miyazakii TaxID=59628 RepID=A0A8S9YJ24_9TREM|nr:hypothetical protein EG68_11539 [Paragonimus skrjabini miyazakii]